MLGSRMWGLGTLGRGAFLHSSAGHREGMWQPAAPGAASRPPRPLRCPQPAQDPRGTPREGLGHPSRVKKAVVFLLLVGSAAEGPLRCGMGHLHPGLPHSPAPQDHPPPPRPCPTAWDAHAGEG